MSKTLKLLPRQALPRIQTMYNITPTAHRPKLSLTLNATPNALATRTTTAGLETSCLTTLGLRHRSNLTSLLEIALENILC
jgi:hypothetical protein